jgi:recombination protein RecA
MKIGVMFGNPETTTGGNALKFYASVRIDIRRTGAIKEGEEVVGNATRIKIVKNKVAPPFREVELEIMYGKGISQMGDLLDLAVKEKMIDKAGSWYACDNIKIGQGREAAKKYLEDNQELAKELRQKILLKYDLTEAPLTTNTNADNEKESTQAAKKDPKEKRPVQ